MAKGNKVRDADDEIEHRGRPENPGGEHEGEGPGGRRIDPPGQDDNDHSERPETPPGLLGDQTLGGSAEADEIEGGKGDDSLSGGEGDDRLKGEKGADTLDGGVGDDTLSGGKGADDLTGGEGNDSFLIDGSAKSEDGLDRILDFADGDRLVFDDGAVADEDNFATATATDFADALAQATALVEGGSEYVAVQVGDDVVVFATEDGEAEVESAVVLVGRTLSDVGFGDIG